MLRWGCLRPSAPGECPGISWTFSLTPTAIVQRQVWERIERKAWSLGTFLPRCSPVTDVWPDHIHQTERCQIMAQVLLLQAWAARCADRSAIKHVAADTPLRC